jgi:lipoate-protein ligase A
MEQTAVEWYSNKLLEILGESVNNFTTEQTMANHYALEQAKEMFEKQIEDAFEKGFITTQWDKTKENKAEQYYNETFKQKP